MKAHTSNFKTHIALAGRELDDKITYTLNGQDITLTSDDLNNVIPNYEGGILRSVMKEIDIDSNMSIPKKTAINYKMGVKIGNSYEYIDFGNYIVFSCDKNEDTNSYNIVAYDKLLYSMKDYEDLNITYPITVRNYIKALCNKIGLVFANENSVFVNFNKTIDKELYLDLDYKYRDVFDELATTTASTICINSNDELEIRYITETNDVIDEDYFKDVNVKFGEKYGPLNSVVLSRSAESDNVFLRDEDSVSTNGLCEIKIVDNQIMNWDNRDEFLPEILEKLNGLEYYINDFSSRGICYYDLCDRYTAKIGDKNYSCIMLNDEVNRRDGLEENIFTEPLIESVTDYSKADKTDRRINKTTLEVDKQAQTIKGLIENVDGQTKTLTKIEQDIKTISTTVKKTEEIVNSTVEKFRVNLESNNIVVSVDNSNKPHETSNYDIKYDVFFMGNRVVSKPTTEDEKAGIVLSVEEDHIRFSVNKQNSIAALDNKFTFKFIYKDEEENIFEIYKTIVISLAMQGKSTNLIAEAEGTILNLKENPNTSYEPIEFRIYGKSSQKISTRNKNICPSQIDFWEEGQYNNIGGLKQPYAGRIRTKNLIEVQSDTEYYFNIFNTSQENFSIILREYNSNRDFIRSIGIVLSEHSIKTSITAKFISITIGDSNGSVNYNQYIELFNSNKIKPFCCLAAESDKSFVPFIPNSPSIEYPSQIISTANIKIDNTNDINQTSISSIINLENNELCSIENIRDELIIKNGDTTLNKRIGKIIFDGTQTINVGSVNENTVRIAFYSLLNGNYLGRENDINVLCSHAKGSLIWDNDIEGVYVNKTAVVFRLNKSIVGTTVASINNWLNNNPITLYYTLERSYNINLNKNSISLIEGKNIITSNVDSEMYIKYWTEAKGDQGSNGKETAIQSDTEPDNKTLMWLDTTTNQLKRYNGEEWELVNDFSHEIDSINSSINDLDASIQDKLHTLENEVNKVITEFETKYTQTNNTFAWEINETLKTIKDKTGELEEKVIEQSEYMKFEAGVGLVIGKSTSPYTLVSKDDGIEIRYNNVPISFWNGDTFKVTRLMLGNFAFTPRDNGSLDFGKVVN